MQRRNGRGVSGRVTPLCLRKALKFHVWPEGGSSKDSVWDAMIENLTVAARWANKVCHESRRGVPRPWQRAPGDKVILACLYMYIQNTDIHFYKHSKAPHIWESPLSKNWSVMPPGSSGPSLFLVSGWPKAFKCLKLIISLMLSLTRPWSTCLSVKKMQCSWNRCKDAGCSDVAVVAGDLASEKELGREQRVNGLPGCFMCWQEKLDGAAAHTPASTHSREYMGGRGGSYLQCFYFWRHGDLNKRKTITDSIQCRKMVNTHTNTPNHHLFTRR